jgi:hypothetical protein
MTKEVECAVNQWRSSNVCFSQRIVFSNDSFIDDVPTVKHKVEVRCKKKFLSTKHEVKRGFDTATTVGGFVLSRKRFWCCPRILQVVRNQRKVVMMGFGCRYWGFLVAARGWEMRGLNFNLHVKKMYHLNLPKQQQRAKHTIKTEQREQSNQNIHPNPPCKTISHNTQENHSWPLPY